MFQPRLSMTLTKKIIGSAPFLYEGSFPEGIAAAHHYGFDCVEINVADPDELDLPTLQISLSKHNITVSALGTGRAYVNDGLSLIDDDLSIRQKAVERLMKFIDSAAILNCLVIVGCIRGNIPDKAQYDLYESRLGASMQLADAHASQKGVTIVIEPINRYENNYLCNAYEVSGFIKRYDLLNTKILLDTFHMNIEESDPIKTIYDNAENIGYIHFADSNRLFPGNGHSDFAAILSALQKCGYSGNISAECLPLPTREDAAKGWLTAVNKLLKDM